MHLHKVHIDEEGLVRLGRLIEEFQCRFLDVAVEVRNADDAFLAIDHGCVDVLAVDLEILCYRAARVARQRALGHLLEHFPQLRVHVGEPSRIAICVGVEVIEADVFHLVIALGVRQRVVRLAEMPFAGEVGLIAALLEHRRQRPFRCRQPTALALERDGGHAAAVRECDPSALRRGRACSSAGHRRKRRSFHRPPTYRCLASAYLDLRHRHKGLRSP